MQGDSTRRCTLKLGLEVVRTAFVMHAGEHDTLSQTTMAATVTLATSQVKVLVVISVTFAWKLFSIVVPTFLNHIMPCCKFWTCLAISRIDGVRSDIERRLRTFEVNRWSESVCHTHGQGRMLIQAASRKPEDC
jgi:hypothetical protein